MRGGFGGRGGTTTTADAAEAAAAAEAADAAEAAADAADPVGGLESTGAVWQATSDTATANADPDRHNSRRSGRGPDLIRKMAILSWNLNKQATILSFVAISKFITVAALFDQDGSFADPIVGSRNGSPGAGPAPRLAAPGRS
jgi:hypothetical protein